jgi:S-adenosylmethionine:tRNA ribosyltransferase-isomerase
MNTSYFDYPLPQELIAQKPLPQRDQSRMMVVDRSQRKIVHSQFKDFPKFLHEGDVLVLNNSRVIPARIWGQKKNAFIEFLFLRELEKHHWEVLCRPARKVRSGDVIMFSPGFAGQVVAAGDEGRRALRFRDIDVLDHIKKIGYAPLPPYIKRKRENRRLRLFDLERYQTVFARKDGSVAAPTAGLHFTSKVMKEIVSQNVSIAEITLHVGLATFQPVRSERVEGHKMLEESYSLSRSAAAAINAGRKEDRPIVAVGTTTVRALESAFREGRVRAGARRTSLFITPGYEFQLVDKLLTNFHLPKSTLLMLVSAFAGRELIREAYRQAVQERYRFYSYGDCMFIV